MGLEIVGKTLERIIRIEQIPEAVVEERRRAIRRQARANELQALNNFCAFFEDPALTLDSYSSLGHQIMENSMVPQFCRASRDVIEADLNVKPVKVVTFFNRWRWQLTPDLPLVPEPISPYQPHKSFPCPFAA